METSTKRSWTNIIGVVSAGWPFANLRENTYAGRILDGVLAAVQDSDYNVLLLTRAWQSPEPSDKWLHDRLVDGLVVIAPGIHTSTVQTLSQYDVPIVAIGSDSITTGVPTVDVDNDLGAELATEHLISLGHRRIAHLAGTTGQTTAFKRRDAFYRAMLARGLDVPDHFVVETAYGGDLAVQEARRLLSAPDRPTAIFGANDHIAFSVLEVAADLGLTVPTDLSVVGYDDSPPASFSRPPLTSVRQPVEDMGQYAANLLLQAVTGNPVEIATHLLLPTLVERSSTAPPIV